MKIRKMINRTHDQGGSCERHLWKLIDMETTVKQIYAYPIDTPNVSIWKKFITWCDSQEKYRFGWLAAALTLHGCVLTILTMFAVVLAGNHFVFWPFVIGAMGITLIVNLAAMPTKITIPVFFLSVLVDLTIIIACVAIGFDINGTTI